MINVRADAKIDAMPFARMEQLVFTCRNIHSTIIAFVT
jgi:hypothetical protein